MIYCAYGSNLNKGQMSIRCPESKVIGNGVLEGYRLSFKGSKTGAYLTIEEAEGYSIPVGLWNVSPTDLSRLDLYEGYPKFYRKEMVMVNDIPALTYVMNSNTYGIPSIFYIETCIAGYEDFGFDLQALVDAYDYTEQRLGR